jgi:hypothetical protein
VHLCNAGDARSAPRQHERQQNADRGHGPVAGNEQSSDVEEDWMH